MINYCCFALQNLCLVTKILFYAILIISLLSQSLSFKLHYSSVLSSFTIVIVCQLLDYHHPLSIFILSKVSQVNTKSSIVDMLLQINLHKTIPFHYSGIKTSRQKLLLLRLFGKKFLVLPQRKFNPIIKLMANKYFPCFEIFIQQNSCLPQFKKVSFHLNFNYCN